MNGSATNSEGIETTALVLIAMAFGTAMSYRTQLINPLWSSARWFVLTCNRDSTIVRSGMMNAAQRKNAKANIESMEQNEDVLVSERLW